MQADVHQMQLRQLKAEFELVKKQQEQRVGLEITSSARWSLAHVSLTRLY